MSYYFVNSFKRIRWIAVFCWFSLFVGFFKLGVSTFFDQRNYLEWLEGNENPLLIWFMAFIFINLGLLIVWLYLKKSNYIFFEGDSIKIQLANLSMKKEINLKKNEIREIKYLEKQIILETESENISFSYDYEDEIKRFLNDLSLNGNTNETYDSIERFN